MPSFNDRIKQLLVLALLLMLVFLTIKELFIFLPGLLGALTLYILSRGHYFQMVYNRNGNGDVRLRFLLSIICCC